MTSSAVVSGVVHAAVVVLCGLWILPFPTNPVPVAIDTVWSDEGAPEHFDTTPLPILSEKQEPGGPSAGLAVFPDILSENLTDAAIDIRDLAALVLQHAEVPQPADFTETVSLAGGAGSGNPGRQGGGEGDGLSVGAGDGNSAFFGLQVEGKRVVYVVDASRSMNHPHPGPMVTRFGRVKLELIRSIRQMTPEQEFFIVYFNDQALPMPARSMSRATPSALEKYLHWAVQVKADGFTNPEQALALALRLRPDVVYFLTDGDFPAKIVRQVTQANRSRVVIHTIGFANDEGEDRLRQIASQNWGEYQFIPDDETGS